MDEKEYEVTITEVLEKKVRYRGRNELEATAKAEADYYAEKIVLGADDFSYRDISAKELVPVKERRNSGFLEKFPFLHGAFVSVGLLKYLYGICPAPRCVRSCRI